MKVTTIDLSEGGMAVSMPERTPSHAGAGRLPSLCRERRHLWNSPPSSPGKGQAHRRVCVSRTFPPEATRQLQEWLKQNSPEAEQDDPPIRCQLTDLSLGGCYLEISSPFPASSRVTLSMRAGGGGSARPGVVRIMHPDKGMGVEFTQATPEHRAAVEKFLEVLNENRALLPELLVEPEGLESESSAQSHSADTDDPLLQFFYGESLTAEQFQRSDAQAASQPSAPSGRRSAAAHA